MKNKKGFTLIELLAVVVILGLVILVAIPFFTGSMKVFRDDYYKNMAGNIEASGKEFFSDNRIYLPHRLLEASIVDVNTLMEDKYLSGFSDYNGNKCENKDSYVIVIKMGRDDYRYETCMKCLDDDYDNTSNNTYCSDAWKNGFTQITFTEAPTVEVYVGTERNKLKEQIKVYPTISRCSKLDVACNNPIVSISAEGEEGIDPIYPKNIDSVNPNKAGEYEVEYQYENHLETVKGKVIVYENIMNDRISRNVNEDGFYFQKTNNYVRGTVTTAAVQETPDYDPDNKDDWAQQNLIITFKYTFPSNLRSSYTVTRYQIFFNNRWEDYCTDISGTNNLCVKTETREMDENVKFRFIDSAGNVSTESRVFNLRIDKTPPTCELSYEEPDGDNDWYVSTINFSFGSKEFPDSTKPFNSANTVNSGELRYGISTGAILASNKDSDKQDQDTKGIRWYGYVEDKANNFTKCFADVKRDTVNPSCSLQFTGTNGNSGWFKKGTVTISYATHTDATSDVASYGFNTDATGDQSKTRSTSTGSSGLAYTAYIKDNAGHIASCSSTLYLDADDPTCTPSKSNLNTPDGVTVSFTCDENVGGSTTNCPSQDTGVKADKPYDVTDVAGNSNTCTVNVYNKQQKQTKSCTTGNRCEAASDGCEEWNECVNDACGTHDCNPHDCSCGTCGGGCKTYECEWCQWSGCHVTTGSSSTCGVVSVISSSCIEHYPTYSCNCKTCYDQCTSSCKTSGCGCDYYHRDTVKCGCETWGNYGDWSDDASCTPNGETESSNHTTYTNCRTVYY